MPTKEWSRAAAVVRDATGAGNETLLGLGRLVQVGEHSGKNENG